MEPGHAGGGGGLRVLVLGVASVVCGVLCALTVLLVAPLVLPESDGAHGTWFLDWFTLLVAGVVVACVAPVGFVAALFLLREARLRPSIPIVIGCAVVTSAATARLSLAGIPIVLLVSLVAMCVCAERFPVRRTRAPAR